MESNQTLIDIINQQNTKIQQLENLLKDQHLNFNNNIKQEYICLFCNQIFTTQDILNHVHQNKEHSDHCIHIDGIKDQLLDINNSNNSSNNIFKNRIETLWSSLKKLSATHSSLNSKMNEITNHFKIYYDYLMSKEHSLKKQIQDDIDLVNSDITHLISEFKSIINIVNINNISSEDKNNNSDLGISLEKSYFEDLTEKYTLSSIIESIQQSESYNKNHNRTFNSSLLKPTEIHSQTKNIEETLHIVKVRQQQDHICDQLQKIIEQSIIVNETLLDLVRFGNLERIKQYFKRNNINKLEYNHNIKSNQQIEIKKTIIEILKSNRIDILEYLFQELHLDIKTQFKPDLDLVRTIDKIDFLSMSALYSNLETIHFIESFGINNMIEWKYDLCLEVSPFSNNVEILQYFSTKVMGIIDSKSINKIIVTANASLLGHIDMLEWISRNTPFSFKLDSLNIFGIDFAAQNGHLETIKWLHHNINEGCTTNAMNNAAKNGYFEIVKWLHHNRTEGCTTSAMNYAAWNGHLEIIKWLHQNRKEGCTIRAMDYAARIGHLEAIKWLHHNRSEGCSTFAMDYAANNGHLETIKWLHENRSEGCTTKAMDYASWNGHLETIKWLHQNRTEGCTTHSMNSAANNGHLEIIKLLHENRTEGCTTFAMDWAAQNGHLEIVKWLHHNRTEGCTTDAMDNAAENGHLETIKWLHQNRTEGCTIHAMDIAAENGHLETIKWLHENRT